MASRPCSECSGPVLARGMCRRHYYQARRSPDFVFIQKPGRSLEERFWNFVVKGPGCWDWTGATHPFGYGVMGVSGRRGAVDTAHRVSWLIHNGPVPDMTEVCHRCDNPPCTRPDHLFLGTHADNMSDMGAKGRSGLRGGRSPKAKLTETAVRDIRARCAAGEIDRTVAESFGVTRECVRDIRLGKRWAHLL